jgi:nicotinamidase-related amidase
LIDAQRAFWTTGHRRAFPGFQRNVEQLLSFCRSRKIEVLHVHSRFSADRSDWLPAYKLRGSIPCIAGDAGTEPLPFSLPAAGEPVFRKTTFDAMGADGLEERLRTRGKRILLIAGLETSFCVFLTAAAAGQRSFLPILVEDACADDPEFPPEATRRFLGRYQDRVLWVRSLESVIAEKDGWQARTQALETAAAKPSRDLVPVAG